MEEAKVTEGLNEWEQIKSPWKQTCSWVDDGSVVVIRDNYLDNDSSIFPPTHHEDLPLPIPLQPQDDQHPLEEPPQGSSFSSLSVSSDTMSDEGDEVGGIGWRVRSQLGLLSSGVIRLAYWVRNYAVCRGGLWSSVGVTGVLVVSLVYVRLQRWRRRFRQETEDRLMLLVKDREQKISQLLLQIARMNEILSARRRVPVIRVG